MQTDEITKSSPNSTNALVMWRFRAYESESYYERGEFFFEKMFNDHTEMKVFSSRHSYENRQKFPDYCSMYWRVENAT